MCGICGVYEKKTDNTSLVRQMCDVLAHRGPDNSAVYQSGFVCLGHRRLSIIDLDTGDQPIFNADKSLAIVYNGEIYNYRELREELRKRGVVFQTKSDTEVILKLYELDGADSFARLNGIFAFAILDERYGQSRLLLARDHFGIKPLHYYCKNDLFLFASEYKAILLHAAVERQLNPQALHHQINLRYNQTNETLIQNIFRLPPAHYMLIENGRITKIERYYHLKPEIDYQKSRADWLADIPFYIKQAVKRQLVADVPIGVYLSGGMDSGSIVAMMREAGAENVNTFTLGFNEPTDEIDDAQITAQYYDTAHRVLRLDLFPMRHMPQVIWHAEEPKINLLQGFAMSGFVSQYVKVALGGLGGDELFSGYDIHKFVLPLNFWHRLVPQGFAASAAKVSALLYRLQTRLLPQVFDEYRRGLQMLLATGNIQKFYLILRNVWDYDREHLEKIYSPAFLQTHLAPVSKEFESLFEKYDGMTPLDQVYFAEFGSKMLNDYLLVEDRMSMSHSLEERVPFLDLDLVAFGFSIPAKMKMSGCQTKGLLRQAMAPYLPESILKKKKWGFTFNPYLQFQKDLKTTAERILTKERIDGDGIFNYPYIRSILQAKPHPRLRWHYNFIWLLTGYYIWREMFLESTISTPHNVDVETFYA
ncbi:asparagine synthase (glutamine-hydrolyzing) [candidate division KSB1 bacterium]|nr:asparagine synthase (glutamine-hydrolyzing) [candidate division KSB1 bacterium]RQW05380.1 MAG: asparagine synthase (glutamine-hydrolyzing) [candidate division KSB1 bacterium]